MAIPRMSLRSYGETRALLIRAATDRERSAKVHANVKETAPLRSRLGRVYDFIVEF
jgi:hypothetical protein